MLERAIELRAVGEAARRKDPALARRNYEEAVALLRRLDDPQMLAHTIRHLGDVYFESGEVSLAEPCFVEALSIYRSAPHTPRLHLANAIRSQALYKTKIGAEQEARALWKEARDLYELESVAAGVTECDQSIG